MPCVYRTFVLIANKMMLPPWCLASVTLWLRGPLGTGGEPMGSLSMARPGKVEAEPALQWGIRAHRGTAREGGVTRLHGGATWLCRGNLRDVQFSSE